MNTLKMIGFSVELDEADIDRLLVPDYRERIENTTLKDVYDYFMKQHNFKDKEEMIQFAFKEDYVGYIVFEESSDEKLSQTPISRNIRLIPNLTKPKSIVIATVQLGGETEFVRENHAIDIALANEERLSNEYQLLPKSFGYNHTKVNKKKNTVVLREENFDISIIELLADGCDNDFSKLNEKDTGTLHRLLEKHGFSSYDEFSEGYAWRLPHSVTRILGASGIFKEEADFIMLQPHLIQAINYDQS